MTISESILKDKSSVIPIYILMDKNGSVTNRQSILMDKSSEAISQNILMNKSSMTISQSILMGKCQRKYAKICSWIIPDTAKTQVKLIGLQDMSELLLMNIVS